VNSDKNIERKEMKNNYSPETINTHFIICCTLYIHKLSTHSWLRTQRVL